MGTGLQMWRKHHVCKVWGPGTSEERRKDCVCMWVWRGAGWARGLERGGRPGQRALHARLKQGCILPATGSHRGYKQEGEEVGCVLRQWFPV